MSEKIFWDAWAFIAVLDHTYRYHYLAKALVNELDRQAAVAVTTEAVLTEVGNAFAKQYLRHHAQKSLDLMMDYFQAGRAIVVTVDHELWQAGWELYCT